MKITVEKDIPYREADGYDAQLNTLDIYYSSSSKGVKKKRPVVLFLHGGNWFGGDKSFINGRLGGMPHWFVLQGYLFVSANFRLVQNARSPGAGIEQMADDVAKAIKWLTINIRRYDGDASEITLAGHSSGAHLATLVACDPDYLQRYRLTPALVKRVIAMDVPHFDLPYALHLLDTEDLGMTDQAQRRMTLMNLMGGTLAAQEKLSPAFHLHPDLKHISFLLLSGGLQNHQVQTFSKHMNDRFCAQLRGYGVKAIHKHFANLDHLDFLQRFEKEISGSVKSYLLDN